MESNLVEVSTVVLVMLSQRLYFPNLRLVYGGYARIRDKKGLKKDYIVLQYHRYYG